MASYVEDARGWVRWPASVDPSAFDVSLAASRAHVAANPYDHKPPPPVATAAPPDGAALPAPPPAVCLHPFVESWDLARCSSCGANLGEARRAAEDAAGQVAMREDSNASSGAISCKVSSASASASAVAGGRISPHARRLRSWGVRVDWLVAFTFAHGCWEWPTWRVMRDVVKPATERAGRCRYAELPAVAPFTGPASVFVSHCWGAPWGDLVLAAARGSRGDRYVWCDIFAVRQWPGNVADLDFRGVIAGCTALVVSTSIDHAYADEMLIISQADADEWLASDEADGAKKKLAFFRLWCVVELAAAVRFSVAVVVVAGLAEKVPRADTSEEGPGETPQREEVFQYNSNGAWELLANLSRLVDTRKAQCVSAADYDFQMDAIRKSPGGVEAIDAAVRGVLIGAMAVAEVGASAKTAPESDKGGAAGEGRGVSCMCPGHCPVHSMASSSSFSAVDSAVCGDIEPLERLPLALLPAALQTAAAGGRSAILRDHLLPRCARESAGLLEEAAVVGRALWLAARGGHAEVLRDLIAAGVPADPVASVSGGGSGGGVITSSALNVASEHGHVLAVQVLLDAGADPWRRNADGSTPLHAAAERGMVGAIKKLISMSDQILSQHTGQESPIPLRRRLVDLKMNDGRTPLFAAARNGHCEAIDALIGFGRASVDQATRHGLTALFVAASRGHETAVARLLASGADAGVVTQKPAQDPGSSVDGTSTVDTKENAFERAMFLPGGGGSKGGLSAVWLAASNGHASVLKELFKENPGGHGSRGRGIANVRDWAGRTPLIMAAKNGHVSCIEALLDLGGADVDIGQKQSSWGTAEEAMVAGGRHALGTALHVAARLGRFATIKTLLARGANASAQSSTHALPLLSAAVRGQCKAALLIAEAQSAATAELANQQHGDAFIRLLEAARDPMLKREELWRLGRSAGVEKDLARVQRGVRKRDVEGGGAASEVLRRVRGYADEVLVTIFDVPSSTTTLADNGLPSSSASALSAPPSSAAFFCYMAAFSMEFSTIAVARAVPTNEDGPAGSSVCVAVAGNHPYSATLFYEVAIISDAGGGGYAQIGWVCSANGDSGEPYFEDKVDKKSINGVGDEQFSWSLDGFRGLAIHCGVTEENYNKTDDGSKMWKEGDVIGVFADLPNKRLAFAVNGQWGSGTCAAAEEGTKNDENCGIAFQFDLKDDEVAAVTAGSESERRALLAPAISALGFEAHVNLGDAPWRFGPPAK